MDIIIPQDFLPSLKNKHLLLDANVFRDAFNKPTIFTTFFNQLQSNDTTLVTIDLVKYELLKGSTTATKYEEREKAISEIIDATLPITEKTHGLVSELIILYGEYGAALSLTDLFLGATLNQYRKNIYLLTRDTTDFIEKIFNLSCILNLPHSKGIITYGVYTAK